MNSIVIDCTIAPAVAELRAAGVVGVCRYLAPPQLSKVIHQAEYDRLVNAGLQVILNWEYDTYDWLGGATKGALHAYDAAKQAKELGYPLGSPIPGSADFDMTRAQWDKVGRSYGEFYGGTMRALGYRPGVYGGVDTLRWCRDELGYDWFWQSMSTGFSQGRNAVRFSDAQLWQRGHITIGGIDCDYNDIINPLYGGSSMKNIIMAHEKGSSRHYVGNGIQCRQIVDDADKTNTLSVMRDMGDPNPESLEFWPGTIGALGVRVDVPQVVPVDVDPVALAKAIIAELTR